jgi:hypothetical protein
MGAVKGAGPPHRSPAKLAHGLRWPSSAVPQMVPLIFRPALDLGVTPRLIWWAHKDCHQRPHRRKKAFPDGGNVAKRKTPPLTLIAS